MKGGLAVDQKKTGSFLKALRNEKGITQEQAAEKLGVAGRTVSRWETGINMPDLSILIEIAEFYDVDIREIIDGERKSENMNIETKETLQRVADYVGTENQRVFKETVFMCAMNIALVVVCSIVCLLEVFKNVSIDGGVKIFLMGFTLMSSIGMLAYTMQIRIGNKKIKTSEADLCAVMSLILGIVSIPFIFTYAFWMVSAALSVGVGLLALRYRTEKKILVATGMLFSVLATVISLLFIVTGYFI